MPLTLGTPMRPAPDTPSIYASEEAWAAFRKLQQSLRGAVTNSTGMTPQEMEATVGTPDPDPVKQQLMDLLTAPGTTFNAGTIGSMVDDPTYKARVAMGPTGGDVTSSKKTSEEETILALAFPEIFRRQSSGKQAVVKPEHANTAGGVERVNANTAEHGTRAMRDAKGNVYLTNINADGSVNRGSKGDQQKNDGRTSIAPAPDTPLPLASSIDMLRRAPDAVTAQGILVNINQTIAQQSSKLTEDALKFASGKVGLLELEAELTESIRTDKLSPSWYPGIGDSPITQEIRKQIIQAQSAAQAIAGNYLKSNTQVAALQAMEANSKVVYETIKRNDEFKSRQTELQSSRTFQAEANREARREDRIEQEDRRIENSIGPLSAKQLTRMSVLDASSKSANGTIDSQKAQKAAYALKGRNPKEFQEAIDLADQDLPAVAMAGNEYALSIVVATEMRNNPGVTETQIREKLAVIKNKALDPGFQKSADAYRIKLGTTPVQKREIEDGIKKRNAGLILNRPDAATKKLLALENFNIALEMERATITEEVIKDAGRILDPNGLLGKAMEDSRRIAGDRNLANIWTAYRGLHTNKSTIVVAKEFNEAVNQSLDKIPQSMFGTPNPAMIRQYLIEAQRNAFRDFLETSVPLSIGPVGDMLFSTARNFVKE